MATIYHNPRCAKSRQTLALLQTKGIDPDIILYLEHPPTRSLLVQLIEQLGIRAEQLVRKSETEFKEHYADRELSEDDFIDAMLCYPKLIERPIVVIDKRAVLGRPPENVLALIP
jgi:arsenate reductase